MSSCFSGGGGGGRAAAYRFESLDFELIKSPSSTTSWISNTLSESSTLAISTRKPRTLRKRPNQVYNEAAALLSTAYPKLFPDKHDATNIFTKSSFEPSDLLIPFRAIDASGGGYLPRRPNWGGPTWPCPKAPQTPPEHAELDFDAESIILDEEIMGEGIDCVMGDFSAIYNNNNNSNGGDENCDYSVESRSDFCYGNPVGLGFETGEIGMRKEARSMRDGDEGSDWWRFPTVSALDSNQRAAAKRKKKKKVSEIKDSDLGANRSNAGGLLLKLNYDAVVEAWSEKASPFAGESDVQGIHLFSDNNGLREASMLRYREKKRNRNFSKKITYQVRKVNADRRPRMKGRFVRTRDTSDD